ncbi:MAG: ATP-binding protein, partial [Bryobacteraceae bacterium]
GHSDARFGCPQIHFSDDAEDARRGFERRKQGCNESYEIRLRRKDEKPLWANVSASPRVDENGNFAGELCMFSDITERKRLEELLRQSQKMEAVGRLAGGIAHDFNNLLTVILGYSGVMESKVSKDDPLGKNILEIRKAGERAAELTQKLLAFSRKQVQRPRVLSLNHLTRDAEPMLRRLIGENVRLSVTLDPAVGNIKADPGQIEQVLMNLCINARDAMANGGELLIVTRRQNLDSGSACLHSLPPGPYVVLEVSDTGCGMDEETKARIFEPFFTTKDPGIGTGLGLSTVLGIVNQSGGAISVYSEINVGSRQWRGSPRAGRRPGIGRLIAHRRDYDGHERPGTCHPAFRGASGRQDPVHVGLYGERNQPKRASGPRLEFPPQALPSGRAVVESRRGSIQRQGSGEIAYRGRRRSNPFLPGHAAGSGWIHGRASFQWKRGTGAVS